MMRMNAARALGAATLLAVAGATVAGAPVGAAAATSAPARVEAAAKGRVDVDVTVINTLYAYYGESYAELDVRAHYRKSGKRLANGTVEVSVTLYPKGWRRDEDGDWSLSGTGANRVTRNVTVNLNGKGRARVKLGQSWRYTEIPPLKGARSTSVGVAYGPGANYLGTDSDPARKKVVQRVVKGEL